MLSFEWLGIYFVVGRGNRHSEHVGDRHNISIVLITHLYLSLDGRWQLHPVWLHSHRLCQCYGSICQVISHRKGQRRRQFVFLYWCVSALSQFIKAAWASQLLLDSRNVHILESAYFPLSTARMRVHLCQSHCMLIVLQLMTLTWKKAPRCGHLYAEFVISES